ncbi:MAG TPA: OmpA family protein, partial [Myxococcota bacterium]
ARRIKQREGIERVVVVGHADALGDPDFNRRLSSWRAHAVRRSLVAWGVPASLLVVRGLGSQNPVAPNTTAAGRRQNRRVEITFEPAPEQK